MTVAETLKAAREFYTRRKKRWTYGIMHDEDGWCVLGAISAVVTNEDRLKGRVYYRPHPSFKNFDLIEGAAAALKESLELKGRGKWASVYQWNDTAKSRDVVLNGLRTAEQWARERGL